MTLILETMFEHNRWANLRTADACAGLTEAQQASTVVGTGVKPPDVSGWAFGD